LIAELHVLAVSLDDESAITKWEEAKIEFKGQTDE
jgi:hypothetical protein